MTSLLPISRSLGLTGIGELNNLFDEFFSMTPARGVSRGMFRMDVRENDKEYVIEAELPGVKKDEVNLNVEDNYLTISVSREESTNQDSDGYIHRERRIGSMSRSMSLTEIDADKIKAKLDQGILTVTVPKLEKKSSSQKICID